MKLVVISFAPFIRKEGNFYAYSPYIKEMEIWAKHVDEIAFMCPVSYNDEGLLLSKVRFPVSRIFTAKAFDVKTLWNAVRAFLFSFWNFCQLFRAMMWADHIHLRCPGNLGLMACLVQIFFPGKVKTAKYAGNWDPKSKQPIAYRLQKWFLASTFLTKKMQVLVYGEWSGATTNIKPFFTASYRETEKTPVEPRREDGVLDFIFVGTLSPGKRPLYAIQLIQKLIDKKIDARLNLYGNGPEREQLEHYITQRRLNESVVLKGNFDQEAMKEVYRKAHFNLLPSRSEGWPKVVAEGMFWGCLPIATPVSCVPNMVGNGSRGLLLTMDLEQDAAAIEALLQKPKDYEKMVMQGITWSRAFTLDVFESEIKALLTP